MKNPTHRATLLSKTVARPGASDAVTRPRAPPTRPLIARARWPGVEERAEPAMIAFTTATETLTAIGTLVTGGGVLYLRKQVEVASQASEEATRSARLQQAQAEGLERTRFEDSLVLAYRAILSELPPEALMNDPLGEQIPKTVLNPFYRYVDLCNWQVFLRAGKRISDDTWTDWEDGIRDNFQRPWFRAAWSAIDSVTRGDGDVPASFDGLRRFLIDQTDPLTWAG